jgi:hypothetical protein
MQVRPFVAILSPFTGAMGRLRGGINLPDPSPVVDKAT